MILACLHRAAEGSFGDNEQLLWLYDIHLLLSEITEDEYKVFIEQVRKKQIRTICHDALEQSEKLFGTEVPAWVKAALSEKSPSEVTARLLEPGAPRYKLSDLTRVTGMKNKWRGIREALFPPPSYILRLEKSHKKIFLPLFYTRRIWQGLRSI